MPAETKRFAQRVLASLFNCDFAENNFVENFQWHGPALLSANGGTFTASQLFFQTLRTAFPNLNYVEDIVLAEEDLVAIRWTCRGTHTGSGLGEPTSRHVLFTGIHIFRMEEIENKLRITGMWQQWGQMGLLQQINLIPFIGGPGSDLPGPTVEKKDAGKAYSEEPKLPSSDGKTFIKKLFDDVINRDDLSCLDLLIAPNIIDHNPGPSDLPGRDGIRQVCRLLRKAFPDFHGRIDAMLSERDFVVTLWTVSGTNSCGCGGINPTLKTMTGTGIDIIRFQEIPSGDILITDRWGNSDDTGILLQLGIISEFKV